MPKINDFIYINTNNVYYIFNTYKNLKGVASYIKINKYEGRESKKSCAPLI